MFIHIYTSLYIYVCLCPSLSIYIQYVHLSSFANDFPSCKFLHAFPIDDDNFPKGFSLHCQVGLPAYYGWACCLIPALRCEPFLGRIGWSTLAMATLWNVRMDIRIWFINSLINTWPTRRHYPAFTSPVGPAIRNRAWHGRDVMCLGGRVSINPQKWVLCPISPS